jgi:hypothetical protein
MAKRPSRLTHPLNFCRIGTPGSEAIISAAEHLGSDGKGKGGLRGYMIFLGKEHPARFMTLLNKVLRTELAKRPTRVGRTVHSQNDSIAIREAITYAAKALGRDGKGRDEMTGYLMSLMSRNPSQFVRLLGTIVGAEVAEHNAQSKPTIQEKMTKLSEMGIQTVYASVMDALQRFGAPEPKRTVSTVYRPFLAAQSAGGSLSRQRTALSRFATARRS